MGGGQGEGGLKVLVTGATGFIGTHLTRLLLKEGFPVRALVRSAEKKSHLNGLDVETIVGDVRGAASMEKACKGCESVFHAAALYGFWAPRQQDFYDINVTGTRNVLEAARKAKVARIVYTSTVGVLKAPTDPKTPADELSFPDERDLFNDYKRSKYQAEQVVDRYAKTGTPVVIVNPTAPVGAYDTRPTPTGKIVLDFLRGKIPAYLDTGLNWVDVEDVARGHLLAAEKGKVGERYILGGTDMTLKAFYDLLAKLSGRKSPQFKIPYSLAMMVALGCELLGKIGKRAPAVSVGAVRMAKKFMYFNSDKAVSQLGYRPGPIQPALERSVEWFRAHSDF